MDILAIDPAGILPRNHRILSNMCLISAGAFAAVNIGHAALNVLFQSKEKPKDKKVSDFISTVNIVGIGNFIIAFAGCNNIYSVQFLNCIIAVFGFNCIVVIRACYIVYYSISSL
jgi:hypothetical protein